MSDTAEATYDNTKLNLRLRSFHQEPSVALHDRVRYPSILTGCMGFEWQDKTFTIEQGEPDGFEYPGDVVDKFAVTYTADDFWEPVCTITASGTTVELSPEHTRVCLSNAFSTKVRVPPSVKRCVVAGSSSEFTLQGDRNVIVVGGSSNSVTANSGIVIELPVDLIPMNVGSLVVTQDGEVVDGTQVLVTNFANKINVLGKDNLIFTTGAFGTRVSGPLSRSQVGPKRFHNAQRSSTKSYRADFQGEIWGDDGSSDRKQTLTLGLLQALVRQKQQDPSESPKAGSSWAKVTTELLGSPTASANMEGVIAATKYSEEGQVSTAEYDGEGYKGRVTVEWTVHPGQNSAQPPTESPDEPNDQSVTCATQAEQDGDHHGISVPLRTRPPPPSVEDGSDSEWDAIGTPSSASSVTGS
ncbi:hypothetical protein JCM24511_09075 [Saitozyma sp. JCM 24511]|nr:hypothetical protein JCM24511_09075 [Saitozyma sp. JCM 24511]